MNTIFSNMMSTCLFFNAGLWALPAKAEAPPSVQVAGLTYRGSGCPNGSARAVIAADRQAFTLIFDKFAAVAASSLAGARATSSCNIVVDLSYPDGWQFTISTVDFRGFAAIDTGAWAKVHASFRYRGGGMQRPALLTMVGPRVSDFLLHEEGGSGREWSPCHRSSSRDLIIDGMLQAHAQGSRYAYLSMDSIDGQVRQLHHIYSVQWRRC